MNSPFLSSLFALLLRHRVLVTGFVIAFLFIIWAAGKPAEAPLLMDENGQSVTGAASSTSGGDSLTGTPPSAGASRPPSVVPGSSSTQTPSPVRGKVATTNTKAPEIALAEYYINTGNDKIRLADYKGKKVVVLEFWSYSGINSRRTIPYLNMWYTKYRQFGLEIIAVHVPEFSFEKDHTAVQNHVLAYSMSYPIVVDNTRTTWTAYGNIHWPRYYIIDMDGKIVYDHIGEGGYNAAEAIIQKLLNDRARILKTGKSVEGEITDPKDVIPVSLSEIGTREIYAGAPANGSLENIIHARTGPQTLTLPDSVSLNKASLGGTWNWTGEYAESRTEKAAITLHYSAKNMYAVFSADKPVRVVVTRDGQPLGAAAGRDIVVEKGESVMYVSSGQLYEVVNDKGGYGVHTLTMTIMTPGLRFYVLRFG